ncbi:MAG: MATE family efflux transporter [Eubacterium sp.]|nr:MATE family efflux transporter [Eubacterium sp.]
MKNMTEGNPAKLIILFTIPLICGNILQQLYNIGDGKIVSEYIDELAFAAVGMTAVVSNTLNGLIGGFTQGFGILIANSFGAKDMNRLRRSVAGSIILTIFLVIVLTTLGMLFIKPILITLNTPEEILPQALSYVRIIIGGIIFTATYNLNANMLRALGDSKTPLFFLIMSVILNLGLDYIFVRILNMGINGAAYATVISQTICSASCLIYTFKRFRNIIPLKEDWKEAFNELSELFTTGLSMGLMGCIVNIGTIILQGAINSLGSEIMAAHVAGRRVLDLLMIMIFTFGFSMTTYVSQNMGAGRLDRVKQGVKAATLTVTAISITLVLICLIISRPAVTWIASTDNMNIIDNGVMYCRTGVYFFVALGPLFVLRCTLQGMGHKIIPLYSSVMELTIKVLSASILVPAIGYLGVALTEPISWVLMTTMLFFMYIHYINKEAALAV